jgi:IclR family transcriptional regulator, KDG regulon repressor
MGSQTKTPRSYVSPTPAVEQSILILKYLASESQLKVTLTDISKRVGISMSKTFSILTALQIGGFVSKDAEGKLYSLGSDLIQIGQMALKNIDYRSVSKPFLEVLARETMCTVLFGLISGEKLFIIGREASGRDFDSSFNIGFSLDMFFRAHGKAILASLPSEEQEKLLSGENFFHEEEELIIDNVELRQQLTEVKKKGFALSGSRLLTPMIKVLSSAVIGRNDYPVGALLVMGLIKGVEIPKYGARLVETATRLSAALGASK